MHLHRHHIIHLAVGSLFISVLFAFVGLRHASIIRATTTSAWQTEPDNSLVVSQRFNSVLRTDDSGNAYVSRAQLVGQFGSSFFTALDPVTGVFTSVAQPNDLVRSVISDGGTGWYIGGDFEYVDGIARNGLAHVLADGSLDETFTVDLDSVDGRIYALTMAGTTLYVGGDFSGIDGNALNNLVAINLTAGTVLTDFLPVVNDNPNSMIVDGSTLYIGGDFNDVSGQTRYGVAAVDATDGSVESFNADLNAFATVNDMVLDGTTLYLGGNFFSVGLDSLSFVAAVSTLDGAAVSAFDPNPDGIVYSLLLSGTSLFVGGDFDNIDGVARGNLAEVATADGTASAMNVPVDSISAFVRAMTLVDNLLYIGGNFTSVNGATRYNSAAVDIDTDTLAAWTGAQEDDIYSMVYSGSSLMTGGDFEFSDVELIGAINSLNADGSITPIALSPSIDVVDAISDYQISGTTLYVVGSSSLPQSYAIAYDLVTGDQLTDFAPDLSAWTQINKVQIDGSSVWFYSSADFMVGSFDAITGEEQLIIPLSVSGSFELPQDFVVGATSVYVGGFFTTINTVERVGIAAFDKTTGVLDESFNLLLNGDVRGMEIHEGIVYLVGMFSMSNETARTSVLAFADATGLLTAWNPETNATEQTWQFNFGESTMLIAGQDLTSVGLEPRDHIVEVEYGTGEATDWTLGVDEDPGVKGLITSDYLYIAGNFDSFSNIPRPGLLRFALAAEESPAGHSGGNGSPFATGITVTSPALGDVLHGGVPTRITWEPNGRMDIANLYYSVDGGRNYASIASLPHQNDSYTWVPPTDVATEHLIIRVDAFDGLIAFARGESVPVTLENDNPERVVIIELDGDEDELVERKICLNPSRLTVFNDATKIVFAGDVVVSTSDEGINNATHYLVTDECYRRPFLTKDIYAQYFTAEESARLLKIVDTEDLSPLPLGRLMPPRPGVSLIKFVSSNDIYAVFPGAAVDDEPILRRFASRGILTSLFSNDWRQFVILLPVTQFVHLTIGEPLTTSLTNLDKSLIFTRSDIRMR